MGISKSRKAQVDPITLLVLLASSSVWIWVIVGILVAIFIAALFLSIVKILGLALVAIGAYLLINKFDWKLPAALIAVGILIVTNFFGYVDLSIGGSGPALSILGNSADFTYTSRYDADPLLIGDTVFAARPLEFICEKTGESDIRYPDPDEACWSTTVAYNGGEITFKPDQQTDIHSSLSVTMQPTRGILSYVEQSGTNLYKEPSHWIVEYKFDVEDDVISSSVGEYQYYAELGESTDIIISIFCPLGNFDSEHAGLWVKTKHDLFERGETWEKVPMAFKKGLNKYMLSVDTSELGIIEMQVQPYIIINADEDVTFRQEDPLTIPLEIVMDMNDLAEDVYVNPVSYSEDDQGVFKRIISWFKELFSKIFGVGS